jgi:hypothetical protein
MAPEPLPRSRLLREYVWFAVMLMAVVMSAAVQDQDTTAMNRFPPASPAFGGVPH